LTKKSLLSKHISNKYVSSLDFSANGKLLLADGELLDVSMGTPVGTLASQAGVDAQETRLSPREGLIFAYHDAALANPSSMQVYSSADGSLLASFRRTEHWLQFSRSGMLFAVQSQDFGVRIMRTPESRVVSDDVGGILKFGGLLR
jgi:hypothetical protein